MSLVMDAMIKIFEKEDTINSIVKEMSPREKLIARITLALITDKLNPVKMQEKDKKQLEHKLEALQKISDEEFEARGELNGK